MNDNPRRRGRPKLARERIIGAALEILDEGGADALSLRTLAVRLSSGTATLYRHVESRTELISMVVDHILGTAEVADAVDPNAGWERVCRETAEASYRALSAHRDAARLLAEALPIGPNMMAVRERMLAVLLRDGFPPLLAVKAVATIAHFVVGFAMQSTDHGSEGGAERERLKALLRQHSDRDFPATASVITLLPRPLDEEFAFGLDLILAGLASEETKNN